jgi:anti-sigma B factor antagonist
MHESLEVSKAPGSGRAAVLRVTGRLDARTASQLIQKCTAVHAEGPLVLNLSGVTFIASSGVGALLALTEHSRGQSTPLVFAAVSPAVDSVLTLLNLNRFLAIYPSEEEAVRALEAA